MSGRASRLEGAIEATLSSGLLLSTALLLTGLLLGADTPLRWGIVLLMFTPVARVIVVAVGLIHERDWLFAALSLFVLGVLASGMIIAARL